MDMTPQTPPSPPNSPIPGPPSRPNRETYTERVVNLGDLTLSSIYDSQQSESEVDEISQELDDDVMDPHPNEEDQTIDEDDVDEPEKNLG